MDAEILDAGGPAYREGMDAEIPMSRRPNAVRESRQSGSPVSRSVPPHLICANPRKAFIPKSIGMDHLVPSFPSFPKFIPMSVGMVKNRRHAPKS